MMISIVVPALNEEESIASTIRALQSLDGLKEIIVVDGGSADQTVTIARSCAVRVLEAPRGRGQQMQAGAVAAQGDVLWFVHADTIPPTCALASIREALAADSVVGGNLGVIFDGPSRAARRMTAIYPWLRMLRLCYGDSGIFVRREIYERVGGFQPVALFEDLDLLRRLRRAGRFVHLQPCMVSFFAPLRTAKLRVDVGAVDSPPGALLVRSSARHACQILRPRKKNVAGGSGCYRLATSAVASVNGSASTCRNRRSLSARWPGTPSVSCACGLSVRSVPCSQSQKVSPLDQFELTSRVKTE